MWKTVSWLIGIVLALLALGMVMLASTSAVQASAQHHNANYYVVRQAVWLVLALVAAGGMSRLDYHRLRPWAGPLVVMTLVLLALCFVPGIRLRVKGSSRWLNLRALNFQPSELAKFATVLFLAWWMDRRKRLAGTFKWGFLLPGGVLALILGMIFIEPDFGTTLLLATVGSLLLVFGGTPVRTLMGFGSLGLLGFSYAVMQDEVRMKRVISFLDPERYAGKEAYQLMQALQAFAIGGLWGVGLGQGMQKRYYLPEAHTDFILAIIGEELGLVATVGVLALFAGFCFCGLRIAWRAPDLFGRLLALGATLTITCQALINVAVVTGSVPTKGIALPFISYGGSNLAVTGLFVGLLLNIARHAGGAPDDDTQPVKDRVRRF